MAQKFLCDMIAQLLEEDGAGIYDYFLNRRSFLKTYYKDFDMKAFIGEKLNDVLNDPKNYDNATQKLTPSGKAQIKNEIVAILADEEALIKRLTGKYDINSVSLFNRINKWKDTPKSKYKVLSENLLRGFDAVKSSIYRGMSESLDTKVTLESGRQAELTANQLFEKPEFKEAFTKLIIFGEKRIDNLDSSISGKLVDYNDVVKRYIASNKTLGDIELAMASMAYSPKNIVKTEGGLDLFSNIISGEQRNYTSKEVARAVAEFVEHNRELFRSRGDAEKVGYMLVGQFNSATLSAVEEETMRALNKTPQGRFKMFTRLVNEGYLTKESAIKLAQKYMDEPANIYKRINNAISTDIATTKMFGRKPLMALDNALKIAETTLDAGEKEAFSRTHKYMRSLMEMTFNPARATTMDSRGYQLADLGGAILKANRITGAGVRTMGDASLGGLKFSLFTGDQFTRSALQGIGITIAEVEGKIVRNIASVTKKVAPKDLADLIDGVSKKLDFSFWTNKMSQKDRYKYAEAIYGAMADMVYNGGIYDGMWTPVSEIASSRTFKESGLKGIAQNWSSNFSGLQFKETVGNVNSWFFSRKFREQLVKYSNDPVIAKYLDEIGFTKDALDMYIKLGKGEASLDLKDHDWFSKRGEEYVNFMRDFFLPKNMQDLKTEQVAMLLDILSERERGELLNFTEEGLLDDLSKLNIMGKLQEKFPEVFDKLEPRDFEIKFQPDTRSGHVQITSDGLLKGGLAEDKQIRLALRKSFEMLRENEMRGIRETIKDTYLKDGKFKPESHKEIRGILEEMLGVKKQSDGTVSYSFGRKEDYFVRNYYLDKFKDFERALFYEFASVKPSLKIRLIQDVIKKHDTGMGMIIANSLAFKSACIDATAKYKNLLGMMGQHMKEGKMFSGKKMAQYADLLTAIGIIGFVNGVAGHGYNMLTDKDKGDIIDTEDIVRKGVADVAFFPMGSITPSVMQTSLARSRQEPINELLKQIFTNDVLVNKFTKDLLGEMSSAYGLERKKKAGRVERAKRSRARAKRRGKVSKLTGRVKKK